MSSNLHQGAKMEESIRQSEQHYQLLFETMHQGVVYQNADGTILSMNSSAARILGKTPEEFLGSSSVGQEYFTIRENGSPFPGMEHPAMVALQTGQEVHDVVMGVFNPREACYRWINIDAVPLFKPGEDRPYQVYTHFDDITERKRAEEALRESQYCERERAEELAAMLDAVPTPVIIAHDPECTHMIGNRAANELLKLPSDGEISLTAPLERRPDHYKAVKEGRELRLDELPVRRAAKGENVQGFEYTLVFDDGTTRELVAYGTPLRDGQGNLRGAVHTLVDITERKKAEEALKESEEKYRSLFDNLNSAALLIEPILDGDGRLVDLRYPMANPSVEKHLGKTPDELVGKFYSEVFPYPGRNPIFDIYERVLSSGEPFKSEILLPAINKYFDISVSRPSTGRLALVLSDISERKHSEEKLLESEEKYKLLFENATDGVVLHELTTEGLPGDILQANEAICQMLGYTKEEMYQLKPMDLQVEGSDEAGEELNKVLTHEKNILFERNLVAKDGRIIPVEFHTSIINLHGNASAISIIRDITERKRSEEALRESEEKYRTIVNAANDGFWWTNPDLIITEASEVIAKLLGYRVDELIGRKGYDFVDPEWIEMASKEWAGRKAGKPARYDFKMKHKDGSVVWMRLSGSPVMDKQGRFVGNLTAFTDITERKQAEEALRKSEEQYRTIVETANEGIWIIDAEARTTYVNEKMAEMLGYGPEEIIGRCSFDFMDEENRAASTLRLKERELGSKSNPEVKYIRKDECLFGRYQMLHH